MKKPYFENIGRRYGRLAFDLIPQQPLMILGPAD
jgi:hypothetical protein